MGLHGPTKTQPPDGEQDPRLERRAGRVGEVRAVTFFKMLWREWKKVRREVRMRQPVEVGDPLPKGALYTDCGVRRKPLRSLA